MTDKSGRNWIPIWILPNLKLTHSIGCADAALVGWNDNRLAELCRKHPRLDSFLSRFTDAFKVRQQPSVLLAREPKPPRRISLEAMASFRDLIVISVVPYARSLMLVYGSQRDRPLYSDAFWLYPWMVDKNYNHIVTHSMAAWGLHEVDSFRGQATPEIFSSELGMHDVDSSLLSALLTKWQDRYFARQPTWSDRALFRSLNMANVACQLPSTVDVTFFDIGRSLALWVSAFEILVHPGFGKSNQAAVNSALDKIEWVDHHLSKKLYRAYDPVRKAKARTTLARRVYDELYQQRNAFLHGNPVQPSSLRFDGRGQSLLNLAPALYRLTLTERLNLRTPSAPPQGSKADEIAAYIHKRSEFQIMQLAHERALLRAGRALKRRRRDVEKVGRA